MRSVGIRVIVVVGSILLIPLLVGNVALVLWVLFGMLFAEVALATSLLLALGAYLLVVVSLAAWYFSRSSGAARATAGPPLLLQIGAFVSVLLTGEPLTRAADSSYFALAFVLGAALPPLIALSVGLRRVQTGISRRLLLAAVLIGTFVSTNLAIMLEVALPSAVVALVLPLRDLMSNLLRVRSLEELLFSRGLVVIFIEVALVAPLAEELTKPLGAVLLLRRIGSRREAFLLGMAGGVGFAVLENMFYEGVWFQHEWLAVTATRGIGGALHPLGAGLIALAIYDVHTQRAGWGRVLGAYALAVAVHMAWNGGLVMLYSVAGERSAAGLPIVEIAGIEESALVIGWLVLVAGLVWRLLFLVTAALRDDEAKDLAPLVSLGLDQPRRLALLSSGLLVAAVVVGEIWGPVLARQLELTLG